MDAYARGDDIAPYFAPWCNLEAVDRFNIAPDFTADDNLACEDIAFNKACIQEDDTVITLDGPFHLPFDADGTRTRQRPVHLCTRPQDRYHFILVIDSCFSRFKHN